MFKILIIQSLYNLSDDRIEFQILDRISFMRFLDICLGDRAPDAKTTWLFREQITEAGLIKPLFDKFDKYSQESGFLAQKGQIIDASIVETPRQRNSREETQCSFVGFESIEKNKYTVYQIFNSRIINMYIPENKKSNAIIAEGQSNKNEIKQAFLFYDFVHYSDNKIPQKYFDLNSALSG